LKVDGSKFLAEKSDPLFSCVHLAAPGSPCFFGASDGEGSRNCCLAQENQHVQHSRMIETVVMLVIGLSMAGVVLGTLGTDESG
jgi:hypothetical protein